MNSNAVFEKINEKNKYVVNCANARNSVYSKYQESSKHYDTLKKGFYTAIELAKIDGNVPEGQLLRYEHLVKHYDKQLLNQLKNREYKIQEIPLKHNEKRGENNTDNEENNMDNEENNMDPFLDRISKIESAGYSRNRFHYEFVDSKQDYEKSKIIFYKEISLASQDGLITEIEEEIHIESMKNIETEFDDELRKYRHNYINNRNYGRGRCGRRHHDRTRGTRGRNVRGGRGHNDRTRDDRGRHVRGGRSNGRIYNYNQPY